MATSGGPLALKEPSKQILMLVLLGLFTLGSSFLTTNKRGLLVYGDPTAFAVDQSSEFLLGGEGYTLIVLDPRQYRPGGNRRVANRLIPARRPSQDILPGAQSPFVGAPGAPTRPSAPGAQRNISPQGPTLPPLSGTSPAGGSLGQGNEFGLGPTPITLVPVVPGTDTPTGGDGGDPTDPTDPGGGGGDPVVPAIPEPSSWLLMIMAVFALGLMLRYQSATALRKEALTA